MSLAPHRETARDDVPVFTDPVHEFFKKASIIGDETTKVRSVRVGYDDACATDDVSLSHIDPPMIPAYASSVIPNWRSPPVYSSNLPLKQVSSSRIDIDMLRGWGATEVRLLGPDYLRYVDYPQLRKIRQRSSNALSRKGAPYVQQLIDFRWAVRVDTRRVKRQSYFTSNGFPVAKSTGTHTRWVVDLGVNKASSAPTDTVFPFIEDVHDHFLLYAGGREDDATSFYGQFTVHHTLWHLFAMAAGAVVLFLKIMAQGWAPATRVAQQALNVMYDVAYRRTAAVVPVHYFAGYVDNGLTLCNSREEDDVLLKMARATHTLCRADFVYGTYSTSVPFTGFVMNTNEKGQKTITLKESWAAKAQVFLSLVCDARAVTIDTKRQAVGVMLWACRVLRHAMAEIFPVIEWTRTESTVVTIDVRTSVQRVRSWMTTPRLLMPAAHLHHITIAAVDATPSTVATVLWASMKFHLLEECRRDAKNPIVDKTFEIFMRVKEIIKCASVTAMSLPFRRCINEMELLALFMAVILSPPGGILLVLTDSMVAKAWTRRGLTADPQACALIRRVAYTARAKGLRILIMHVISKLNPADKYTRGMSHVNGTVEDGSIRDVPSPESSVIQVTSWM